MNAFLSFCIIFACWCGTYILSREQRELRVTDRGFSFIQHSCNKTVGEYYLEKSTEVPLTIKPTNNAQQYNKRLREEAILFSQRYTAFTQPEPSYFPPYLDLNYTRGSWKWKDGDVDYDKLTENILNRFRSLPHSTKFVVFQASDLVGFGNQFRSLYSVFLLALVSGRQLRIRWDDYFRIMDSPFKELRYNATEVKKLHFRQFYQFQRGFCNFTKYSSHNVDRIFGKNNLYFNMMSDISCLTLPNIHYRMILSKLGFDVSRPDHNNTIDYEADGNIRRQFARLLFTPNKEIAYHIRSNLDRLQRPVIGLQVRTGGNIAITRENNSFLNLTSLQYFTEGIRAAAEEHHWNFKNITVFVSTDSNAVVKLLRQEGMYKSIITGAGYQRGHSSPYLERGDRRMMFLKQAILDLVLLSQSDHIVYTSGSSYGRLGLRLSYNKTARAVCKSGLCT